MKFYTASKAAEILDLGVSRVLQLCRKGRLGYSTLRHGRAWIITDKEIEEFQKRGKLPPGRPKKTSE